MPFSPLGVVPACEHARDGMVLICEHAEALSDQLCEVLQDIETATPVATKTTEVLIQQVVF